MSIDYYNSYVIHPMMVDFCKILYQKNKIKKEEYNLAVKRMVRHSEFLERMISPEGYFPVFGRSITYRMGSFQALAQTALMHQLPKEITPAQVRAGLTAIMKNMFYTSQNFDKEGWLLLGFNGHQPNVADSYISTGSLYLTCLIFLPLGLNKEDEFWSSAPEK